MTIAAFGLVRPVTYKNLEKGMLVLAAPSAEQRYFGVITKIREDTMLVVLNSTDGDVPCVMDVGYVIDDLWHVPGSLEIEPVGEPFQPLHRRSSPPTYAMDSNGVVSAFFHHNDMGRTQQYVVGLADGEHVERADKIAFFKSARLFIRQEGRKDRYEWPDLTAER